MFARMRLYAAYVDPSSLERDRAVSMVKQGMSWPAFFFTVLWALWHRMWWTAAILLLAVVGLDLAFGALGADEIASGVVGLGLAVYIGSSANDWRGRALEHRGMRLTAIVAAPDSEQAAHRWLERGRDGVS